MKTFSRASLFAALLSLSGIAQADWSTNLGFVSEYHYRGIFQGDTSASGGVDYESNGFFAGTWVADVDLGLEYDVYAGYGGEVGDFGYSIGYTGYFYTDDDFDDTYQEINLGATYGIFALDVAVGRYDNFDGPRQDYTFYSLTAEHKGFYGKVGAFSQDFDGEYFEAGYGTTVREIDLGVSVIFSNEDLVGFQTGGKSNEAIVFSIGKSFDL